MRSGSLRITEASLERFKLGGARARDALLVRIGGGGYVGRGEAAPISGFSGETTNACAHGLRKALRSIAVSGRLNVDRPAEEAVGSVMAAAGGALRGLPSAECAVETALLDLVAQHRRRTIAGCFGDGKTTTTTTTLPLNALVRGAPESWLEQIRAARERGYGACKMKIPTADDVAIEAASRALHAARDAAPDLEMRLDPNGSWSIERARSALCDLATARPRFVEQPVAPRELRALGPCAVPWAADESLAHEDDVPHFRREGGCGAFVIKPAALGWLRARSLAIDAAARGLDVVVTHFFDGPIGMAAACELAFSLGDLARNGSLRACGLDRHAGLEGCREDALPHHAGAQSGFVRWSDRVGLGVPERTWIP